MLALLAVASFLTLQSGPALAGGGSGYYYTLGGSAYVPVDSTLGYTNNANATNGAYSSSLSSAGAAGLIIETNLVILNPLVGSPFSTGQITGYPFLNGGIPDDQLAVEVRAAATVTTATSTTTNMTFVLLSSVGQATLLWNTNLGTWQSDRPLTLFDTLTLGGGANGITTNGVVTNKVYSPNSTPAFNSGLTLYLAQITASVSNSAATNFSVRVKQ